MYVYLAARFNQTKEIGNPLILHRLRVGKRVNIILQLKFTCYIDRLRWTELILVTSHRPSTLQSWPALLPHFHSVRSVSGRKTVQYFCCRYSRRFGSYASLHVS